MPASLSTPPILSKPVSDDQLFDAVTRVTAKPDKVMRLKLTPGREDLADQRAF